jgi:hypothetical protein
VLPHLLPQRRFVQSGDPSRPGLSMPSCIDIARELRVIAEKPGHPLFEVDHLHMGPRPDGEIRDRHFQGAELLFDNLWVGRERSRPQLAFDLLV